MFKDIGNTIKGVATAILVLGFGLSLTAGFLIFYHAFDLTFGTVIVGIITILGGFIGSFIVAALIYGFGQLIDEISAIRKNQDDAKNSTSSKTESGCTTQEFPEVHITHFIDESFL